jgi:hypothetical protein
VVFLFIGAWSLGEWFPKWNYFRSGRSCSQLVLSGKQMEQPRISGWVYEDGLPVGVERTLQGVA